MMNHRSTSPKSSYFSSCSDHGPSGWIVRIAALSCLLNILVCYVVLTGNWTHAPVDDAAAANTGTGHASAHHQELALWKGSHATIRGQFEQLKTKYEELQIAYDDVRRAASNAAASTTSDCKALQHKVASLEQSLVQKSLNTCSPQQLERVKQMEEASIHATQEADKCKKQMQQLKATCTSSDSGALVSGTGSCPPSSVGQLDQSRLLPDDLTLLPFDPSQHEITWTCPPAADVSANETLTYCEETPTNEQGFQLSFFDRPGAGSRAAIRKPKPQSPKCVQLPPANYQFPKKQQSMPLAIGESAVNWSNLRVQKLEDLLVFNRGTPKNLYHFNASFYDYEQEHILDLAAKYIPFGHKIRLMLDVGSGGASLGLLAKRRYDTQVVSTVFADWPYCEYITERGNVCMYIDAMEAMPFSKFSYDLVHSSWVFHALFNHQLREAYLEQNRILRPGGYMWIYGGWSFSQVETIENLFLKQLGYTVLYEKKNIVDRKKVNHHFDSIPFELEWTAILLKPIRIDEKACQRVYV